MEIDYIKCGNTNHAKGYANIKTHKQGWPYCYIISCRGSAIEQLGRWVEFQLKKSSPETSDIFERYKTFPNFIEDLNENQGRFKKEEVIMISRDIQNFHPSCDKDKCIQAIKILLDTRTYQIPSKECILEAVDITVSSNTAHFCNRYFTQTDGETIGSPDSGSITDIYGTIHIDKKFIDESPVKPQNYKRYRDITIDICKNSSKQEQNKIIAWLNENICKDKIIFKVDSMGDEVTFLDTQINVMQDERNEEQESYILVPRMYSKETDTHQYPAPNSCHPDHASKNIPTTVVHRCRMNC